MSPKSLRIAPFSPGEQRQDMLSPILHWQYRAVKPMRSVHMNGFTLVADGSQNGNLLYSAWPTMLNILRGCSKSGQNSPARCRVIARNAPSRTQKRTLGPHFCLLPRGHGIRSTTHSVYPMSHCTVRVLPAHFLNRLYKEVSV